MTNKKNLRALLWYSAMTALTLVFGIVYTYFGHGVTSDYMTYAFAPLLIATFLYLLFTAFEKIPRPERFSATFLAFAATSLTLSSIARGILQIAGAYSNYDGIVEIAGYIFLVIAILLYPTEIILQKKQQNLQ